MEIIEKKLRFSIDKIESLSKEKYFEVCFDHLSIDKAVAKTLLTEKGFYFEFAKMILTSQDDMHKLFDNNDKIIQFKNFYTKINFKINQCAEFTLSTSLSGSTDVKGYINDFTTNHIETFPDGYYRAILLTKHKFTVSKYFGHSKGLKVRDTTFGSGIIDLTINTIQLQIFGYYDEVTSKNYFIIETVVKCKYQDFVKFLDDIILSIAYLTGEFLGKSIFVLASNDNNFEKNELLCLKSFYDDLNNGIAVIPDFHFLKDIVGNMNDIASPELISKLAEEISKNIIFKRTILLICQAHSEPSYVKATLFSVALETITNLIYEQIEAANKPVQDPKLSKKIRISLKKTLDEYKSEITEEAYEKFCNDINRLNSLTNKQKLLLPFKYLGFSLPIKDREAIEKRNDFLHGRIPENGNKHNLPITIGRLLFCINFLVLKHIDFSGYIFYPAVMYQHNNKLPIDELPLRKI